MAAKIAPGMNRSFTAETWTNLIGKKYWYEAIDEANDLIEDEIETDIQGYDIDGSVVRMARENAENAGVAHLESGWKTGRHFHRSIVNLERVLRDWTTGQLI